MYLISEQRNLLEILRRIRGFLNCRKFTQNLSKNNLCIFYSFFIALPNNMIKIVFFTVI